MNRPRSIDPQAAAYLQAATWLIVAVGCGKQVADDPPPLTVPSTFASGSEEPPDAKDQKPNDRADDDEATRDRSARTRKDGNLNGDSQWWTEFGDPQLNELVEEALRNNRSVRARWARVQQAHHFSRQARAARLPQVGASVALTRARGINVALGSSVDTTVLNASLPVSYELNLYGRFAREHNATRLERDATRSDLETLSLGLAAEVSEAFFDLVDARARQALLAEQLQTNQTFYELVRLRFERGLTSVVDVHQQRQQVAASKADLALVEGQAGVLEKQLAVLIGSEPGRKFATAIEGMPKLAGEPQLGAPASVLAQRPDIKAIQQRLKAADRRVHAAIGAHLPSLSLNFTPGYQRLSVDTSMGDSTQDGFVFSAGATLSAPLFDGVRIPAQIKQNRAVVSELVEQYADAVLNALLEVERAVVLERQQRTQIRHLHDQVKIASELLTASRERYRTGLSDFLPVLTALRTEQGSQVALLSAKRELISSRIQLYRALGGRWPSKLSEPDDLGERSP